MDKNEQIKLLTEELLKLLNNSNTDSEQSEPSYSSKLLTSKSVDILTLEERLNINFDVIREIMRVSDRRFGRIDQYTTKEALFEEQPKQTKKSN